MRGNLENQFHAIGLSGFDSVYDYFQIFNELKIPISHYNFQTIKVSQIKFRNLRSTIDFGRIKFKTIKQMLDKI